MNYSEIITSAAQANERKASRFAEQHGLGFTPASRMVSRGNPPAPPCWIALIIAQQRYNYKECCPQLTAIAWWYRWQGVWTNDGSYEHPMPRMRKRLNASGQNYCLQETGEFCYLNDDQQSEEGNPLLSGSWALNISEFDMQQTYWRRSLGILHYNPTPRQVLMSWGWWVDPNWCADEHRTPRMIPYFDSFYPGPYVVC